MYLYFHQLIKLKIHAERNFLFCCMNDSLQVMHRWLALTLFAMEKVYSLFNSWGSNFQKYCFMLIGCLTKVLLLLLFWTKRQHKGHHHVFLSFSDLENSYRQSSRIIVNNLGALWEVLRWGLQFLPDAHLLPLSYCTTEKVSDVVIIKVWASA